MNNDLIIKINHINSIEANKDIINKFLDLIDLTFEYKIIEIEINNFETNNIDELYNILI